MEFLFGKRAGFKSMPGHPSRLKNPADGKEKNCRQNKIDRFKFESRGESLPI
jgi:hypothetical protein